MAQSSNICCIARQAVCVSGSLTRGGGRRWWGAGRGPRTVSGRAPQSRSSLCFPTR